MLRTDSRESLSGYSGSWEAFFDFQLSILQLFEGEAAAAAGGGGLEDRMAEIDFDLGSEERDGIEVGLIGDGCLGLGWRKGLGRRDAAEVAVAVEGGGVRAIAFAGIVLHR